MLNVVYRPRRKRPLGLTLIVVYKTLWGLLEMAAGLFVTWAPSLLRSELTDDPQDQLAAWLVVHAPLEPQKLRLVTAALLVLGLFKIALAVGIWYGSWLVRDIALVVMGIAGVFSLAALALEFSTFKLVVAATDLLIVLYLWRFMPRHLPPRSPSRQRAGATLAS